MTTINHDAQGFLVGQVLDTQRQLLRGQERELSLLQSIDASLKGRGGAGRMSRSRASSPASVALPTVVPVGRSPRNRPAGQPPTVLPTVTPAGRASRTRPSDQAPVILPTVSPSGRDSRGRFVGKGGGRTQGANGENGGGSPPAPPKPPKSPSSESESKLSEAVKGVKDMVKGAADNIDPTIQAAKEIKETISPLGRGWKAAFGKSAEQKKERWYKRILAAISGRKTESSGVASSADGGGLGEAALGLVGRFLPAIGAILGPALLVVMAGLAGLGIGKVIHEWMVSSGVQDKLFDAIDSMKAAWTKVQSWFGEKLGKAKEVASNAAAGANQAIKSMTGVDVGATVDRVKRLVGINGTERVYEKGDGTIESRTGGSISWRNNNPGNLKFEHQGSADKTVKSKRSRADALKAAQARYEGVVDLDQYGNAIFGTAEQGLAAQAKLLKQTHGQKTIEEMLPGYAKGDYSGKAHHDNYAKAIYAYGRKMGVDLTGKAIGSLNEAEMAALQGGMKSFEGYKVGAINSKAATVSVRQALLQSREAYSTSLPSMKLGAMPSSVMGQIPKMPDLANFAFDTSEAASGQSVIYKPEVGQNLSDRGIAHIVTGGMGGSA